MQRGLSGGHFPWCGQGGLHANTEYEQVCGAQDTVLCVFGGPAHPARKGSVWKRSLYSNDMDVTTAEKGQAGNKTRDGDKGRPCPEYQRP